MQAKLSPRPYLLLSGHHGSACACAFPCQAVCLPVRCHRSDSWQPLGVPFALHMCDLAYQPQGVPALHLHTPRCCRRHMHNTDLDGTAPPCRKHKSWCCIWHIASDGICGAPVPPHSTASHHRLQPSSNDVVTYCNIVAGLHDTSALN